MENLDKILNDANSGEVINLSNERVYVTKGNSTDGKNGAMLKPGVILNVPRGTTVFCQPPEITRTTEWCMLYGDCDGARLKGLIFIGPDNTTPQTKKLNGISLRGRDITIEECETRKTYGNYLQKQECFAIKIFNSINGTIKDCKVSECLGDYTSAFGLEDGWITHYEANLPRAMDLDNRFHVGVNIGRATNNTRVALGIVRGGTAGFYVDSHVGEGLDIEYNTFIGVRTGFHFVMQYPDTEAKGVSNFTISRNTVILDPIWGNIAFALMDNTPVSGNFSEPLPDTCYIRDIRFITNTVDLLNDASYNTCRLLNAASGCQNPTDNNGIKNISFYAMFVEDKMPKQGLFRNYKCNAKNITIEMPMEPQFITI